MPSSSSTEKANGRHLLWRCLDETCEWDETLPLAAAPPGERPYCPGTKDDLRRHKLTAVDMIEAEVADRLAEALEQIDTAAHSFVLNDEDAKARIQLVADTAEAALSAYRTTGGRDG